jgi:alkanesulfonate monooxygenase SsuD/methylene tetrahydromethanopterin reductase-like flavin-dependent oxidoreductase (luciferase family)
MLEQFGFDPAELHVAPRLREAHTAMRSLLDSGQADMDGRFHRYRAVFTNARAVADRVPLLLGAMGGPLTFRLAGEIADGVYAACSFSPAALDYLVSNVQRGADQAGRNWRTLELAASLTCAVSEHRESAKAAARAKAAFYLPSMPPKLVERHGVSYAEVEPICRAFARGGVAEALRRTPDELADRFCIAGTPEDIVDRIRADVLPSGINHIVLALTDRGLARDWAGLDIPGLPPLEDQVRLIGTRILPELSMQ